MSLILLCSGDSSAQLSTQLKRVQQITSTTPILILPENQNGLLLPGLVADRGKSNSNPRLNLKKLARFLRCGLRQHQLQSELSRLAISDELTGLHNRRGFLLLGSERMKMAIGMKKNLLLFYADLDNLKQINDQFGHQEGDKALLRTAEVFRRSFRNSDITARFGGDEFTALVIEELGQTAEAISSRLQDNMARLASTNSHYQLSLSVGMTRYAAETPASLKKLLAEADRALYKQKQAGYSQSAGNSVVAFPGRSGGHSQRGFRAPDISSSLPSREKTRKSS
jgi:diguanylate cyclase (GGDEF)-like protein